MWGSAAVANLKSSLTEPGTKFVNIKKTPEVRVFQGGEETTPVEYVNVKSNINNEDLTTKVEETSDVVKQEEFASTDELAKKNIIGKLVLDAGAFITGVKLDAFGPDCEYYTIEEVVNELKDDVTRDRFRNFPYPIIVKNVSDESMSFVTAASKITGDFFALSATDRKVIALTHQLEVQTNGTVNLKKDLSRPYIADGAKGITTEKKKKVIDIDINDIEIDEEDDSIGSYAQNADVYDFSLNLLLSANSTQFYKTLNIDVDEHGKPIQSCQEAESEGIHGVDAAEQIKSLNGESTKFLIPGFEDGQWITPTNVEEITSKTVTTQKASARETAGKPSTSITLLPNPIAGGDSNKSTTASSTLKTSGSSVACITTDYAMQNVMLQTGLRIISANGYAVTSLRQFLMGCHACYTMSRDMGRGFCPSCGGYTMVRVGVNVDKKGKVNYVWPLRKINNTRGTIYNIPKMYGGKKSTDLILREDMMPKAKLKDLKAAMAGPVDYFDNAEYGFVYASAQNTAVFGYGHKNPNEVNRFKSKK